MGGGNIRRGNGFGKFDMQMIFKMKYLQFLALPLSEWQMNSLWQREVITWELAKQQVRRFFVRVWPQPTAKKKKTENFIKFCIREKFDYNFSNA